MEVPVTLAADVSGLDVPGDPPGSLADAALALMAAALADEVGLGICQARRAAREAPAFDRTPWTSHLSRERASAIASSAVDRCRRRALPSHR